MIDESYTPTPGLNRRAVYVLAAIAIAITVAIVIGVIVNNRNEAAARERRKDELVCAVALEEGDAGLYNYAGCDE